MSSMDSHATITLLLLWTQPQILAHSGDIRTHHELILIPVRNPSAPSLHYHPEDRTDPTDTLLPSWGLCFTPVYLGLSAALTNFLS